MIARYTGVTSRSENIYAMVRQKYLVDPATIVLSIDGVTIDAPDDLDFVESCNWIFEQIKNLLGYHIIEMMR